MPPTDIEVALVQGGTTIVLDADSADAVVREGTVTLRLSTAQLADILFDDMPLFPVWSRDRKTAYSQLDLTNEVGFHRITIRREGESLTFDFRTATAKATWTDVQAMARQVVGEAFNYRRQFFYSLPAGPRHAVRLPEVDYGWLRDRIGEICRLVDDIDRRPARETRRRVVTSLVPRRVSVPHTLKYLRENRDVLEAAPSGPISVEGTAYWPSSVKVWKTSKETAALEHSQIARFLRSLADCCQRLRSEVPVIVAPDVEKWSAQVAAARRRSVIQRHEAAPGRPGQSPLPTFIQMTDARYRRLRELYAEFLRDIELGDPEASSTRTNLKEVSEIYQTYVGHIIGQALGLKYVSERCELRERDTEGRSMRSGNLDLFYDSHPPATLLPSWRDGTDRPGYERPDVVVIDRDGRRAIVVDAKFRIDQSGRTPADALQEMQGYLQSFSIRRGGIAFPAQNRNPRRVEANGFLLLELPIYPLDTTEPLLEYVRGAIADLWTPLPD
jgi:hypothetical protein